MEVIQDNKTAPHSEDLSLWSYFVRCITTKYSDFSGRARRKEWWGFVLFQLLIFIVPITLYSLMGGSLFLWATLIVVLLLFVPWLAVTCRRFHDVGLSTGLFWVVGGLTILKNVIALFVMIEPGVIPHAVTSISKILSYLTGLVMLVIAFIPGKTGPNAYGPDPKPAPNYEGYGQI